MVALISCDQGDDLVSATSSTNTVSNEPETDISQHISKEISGMVVTANPHATDAGVAILEAGGSAVDAAIAIQSVLSLVEPQSSGLGGGGFMVFLNAETKQISVYDGREKAPAGATKDMFIHESGEPMSFFEAKNSGVSIGVPGIVSLLELAHKDQGKLAWALLFDDAIDLAERGFDVSPRLNDFLLRFERFIPSEEKDGPLDAYNYFYEAPGKPKTRLVNQEYARTLNLIKENPGHFYEGELAQALIAAANTEPRSGTLSLEDLSGYKARKLEPLCFRYRTNTLCGPPPPSSWVAVAMTLGILEQTPQFGAEQVANESEESNYEDWHIFAEAMRLAYADRDHYVADDEFVDVPLKGMLNQEYLKGRAANIDPSGAASSISFGQPPETESSARRLGKDTTDEQAGTTHFTVVDSDGNVVSMTSSVESLFGSTRMAGGMFLNNQLTDFARIPEDTEGKVPANIVEPGKRPRSSMSPTIVVDKNGDFLLSTGSPGGNSIIAYNLKTLVAVLDWGMTPQQAVELPNMIARGDKVSIEQGRASPELIESLRSYGFNVKESGGENSGLSMIMRTSDGSLIGGVDPRREGTIGIPHE